VLSAYAGVWSKNLNALIFRAAQGHRWSAITPVDRKDRPGWPHVGATVIPGCSWEALIRPGADLGNWAPGRGWGSSTDRVSAREPLGGRFYFPEAARVF
jgi:hypothetical protein